MCGAVSRCLASSKYYNAIMKNVFLEVKDSEVKKTGREVLADKIKEVLETLTKVCRSETENRNLDT